MHSCSAFPSILLKVLFTLSALVASVSPAFCLNSVAHSAIDQGLPTQYGRVIFQKNQDATNQIFIIGQAHRSEVSGENGQNTVQAQMEIFRIGEWLIRQKNVEILLPEGFFQKGSVKNGTQGPPITNYASDTTLDSERLRSLLQDTRRFVSADTLLSDQYPIRLGQVEDEKLYQTVSQLLRKLGNRHEDLNRAFEELNDYQRKRTAIMLQNIPFAVESVFQRGDIENKNAIFTIGMAHIADILEFFHAEAGKIAGNDDLLSLSALDLLEQGYGVTVILPKSLAEDDKVLRLTRLEHLAFP